MHLLQGEAVKLELTSIEKRWVTRKWEVIREAQQKADTAGRDWARLSDEINTYLDGSKITDPLQRARVRAESLALAEAFASGEWFADEARRHIDDLSLFLQMKEHELL